MPGRFPVVAFDLDGTLLRTTTVSLHLADWMGRGDEIVELERQFRLHEISNSEVADASAAWFTGRTEAEVHARLQHAPWIAGMGECLAALAEAGTHLLLGTVTWRFAAEMLADRFGFEAVCGTEMATENGVLSGRVSRHFDEHDKLRFVEAWCAMREIDLAQVAAVGDSRSDVPALSARRLRARFECDRGCACRGRCVDRHPRPARHPPPPAVGRLRRLTNSARGQAGETKPDRVAFADSRAGRGGDIREAESLRVRNFQAAWAAVTYGGRR